MKTFSDVVLESNEKTYTLFSDDLDKHVFDNPGLTPGYAQQYISIKPAGEELDMYYDNLNKERHTRPQNITIGYETHHRIIIEKPMFYRKGDVEKGAKVISDTLNLHNIENEISKDEIGRQVIYVPMKQALNK